jgi:hypothetical protein
MLWALQVRLSKKVAIGVLLSSGLFVIGAAVTRAVLTLGATPSGLNINRWGVRETIVGILTVNMPIMPPMFQNTFWSRSAYHDSYTGTESKSKSRHGKGTFELRSRGTSSGNEKEADIEVASQESQENIIRQSSRDDTPFGNVTVQTSIQIRSEQREDDGGAEWNNDRGEGACNSTITANKKVY